MTEKPKSRRVPSIYNNGYKVFAPVGRRRDGKWSKVHQIIAVFRIRTEATQYVKGKRAAGIRAYIG